MADRVDAFANHQRSHVSGCLLDDTACLKAAAAFFETKAAEEKQVFAEKQAAREKQAAEAAEDAADLIYDKWSAAGSFPD